MSKKLVVMLVFISCMLSSTTSAYRISKFGRHNT